MGTNVILKDKSPELTRVDSMLHEIGVDWFTLDDRATLRNICELILNRSADLCAMALYTLIRQMGETGERDITAGVDGSVYKTDPGYKERLKYTLNRLIFKEPGQCRVRIVDTEDGSGLGAALVVAGNDPDDE